MVRRSLRLDFGVAQMLERTMTASVMVTVGKRGYMSPPSR